MTVVVSQDIILLHRTCDTCDTCDTCVTCDTCDTCGICDIWDICRNKWKEHAEEVSVLQVTALFRLFLVTL